MEPLIAAAFLLVFGVTLYKAVLTRVRTPKPATPLEAASEIGKAFIKLIRNGKELALFALFEAAAIGACALSLAAFGPRVSVIALLICVALLILFAWKPPPKAQ
jgi:hypothetical protein